MLVGRTIPVFPLPRKAFLVASPVQHAPISASSGSARPSSATSADVMDNGLRRAGFTSVGQRKGAAMRSLLTSGRGFGNADVPQNRMRRIRRLYHSPQFGKKCGLSCFVSNPASGVSSGRCYILTGHVQYPRGLAASFWPGSVFRLFLCSNPKQNEVPMFRFLLSSRWTRFQYRLVSSLQPFPFRPASTASLAPVLALPVLYFVEVVR